MITGDVVWDGKDLAAIQELTASTERQHGMPVVSVDAAWNLQIWTTTDGLMPVRVGQHVVTDEHGCVTVRG